MGVLSFLGSWARKESGSTTVEFAMVGMGFIFLMVGVLEFGRLAWTANVVDYAVDEAARYASLHQGASDADIEEHARNMLSSLFVPASALSVTVSNETASGVDFIAITGSYNFTSMTSTILPASLSTVDLEVRSRRPVYEYDN